MNPFKNEKQIKLGEVEILLRPSFENVAALENNVEPVMAITQRLTKGAAKVPITLLAQIIYYCQAARKPENLEAYYYSLEEIWTMLQTTGSAEIFNPVLVFIGQVFAGDKTANELSESQKKS